MRGRRSAFSQPKYPPFLHLAVRVLSEFFWEAKTSRYASVYAGRMHFCTRIRAALGFRVKKRLSFGCEWMQTIAPSLLGRVEIKICSRYHAGHGAELTQGFRNQDEQRREFHRVDVGLYAVPFSRRG